MKTRIIRVTDFEQNCSLIWCEDTMRGALVDPGGNAAKLIKAAAREKVQLEKILLTHGHIDHVGAAKDISLSLNIPIIGPHRADEYWFDLLSEEAELFDFPPLEVFKPDQWLEDGDTVQVGNMNLNVWHTPGHTPGHIVFYNDEAKTVFVGDVLFKNSVGRTDFPGGNEHQLLQSIQNKLLVLDDEVTVMSGHGPATTIGRERLRNPFLQELKEQDFA